MITVDPQGTLLSVAAFSLLMGAACAMLSALAIYLGATRMPPRIARGRVWAEWRRRRVLWGLSLLLGLGAALHLSDMVFRAYGPRDLSWVTRQAELYRIALLGGASGFLLVCFLFVAGALIKRRRR